MSYHPRKIEKEKTMPSMRQIAALPAILLSLLLLSAVTPAVASEGWGSGTTQGGGDSKPTLGFAVRGGAYGVPDWILDILFEEHPSVDGTMVGAEIRYFGKGGPSGIFSIALTLDAGSTDGFGIWREGTGDPRVIGGGAVDLVAGTVTAYWDIKPSSTLHPYFGLGLGLGYAEGTYDRENEAVTVKEFVPVVHVPVGLMLNLGPHFGVAVEGRIIDGLSWGGMLQVRF
jgi:hypothetical protein